MLVVCDSANAIQDISSAITAFAAGAGAILAIKGFNAWKDQLKGKTNYELARRYLRAVYKVRDAIKFVRNPFIPAEEISFALKETGKDIDSDRQETDRAVYSLRWKKVVEAESDLKIELWEAEVSWGKNALVTENDFRDCIRKIFVAVKMHLDREKVRREDPNLIYDYGEKDEFNIKMEQAIKKIEEYLAPHLK